MTDGMGWRSSTPPGISYLSDNQPLVPEQLKKQVEVVCQTTGAEPTGVSFEVDGWLGQ